MAEPGSRTEPVTFKAPGGAQPDVFIDTPFEKFSLHSGMLTFCSRWFAASMSQTWWKEDAVNETLEYRYVLEFDKEGSTLMPERNAGKSPGTKDALDNKKQKEICAAFLSMFRCFYRQPIEIVTVKECTALVNLADQYDAIDSIGESIRSCLFEWPDIDLDMAVDPISFLILGFTIRSTRVFNEAFIHAVGQFRGKYSDFSEIAEEKNLPNRVIDMVRSECSRLDQLVSDAMKAILVLGLDEPSMPSGPASQVAAAILKKKLGKFFASWPKPENEGLLFRHIMEHRFEVTAEDIMQYAVNRGCPVDIHECSSEMNELASQLKMSIWDVATNNLQSKQELDYLTCAQIFSDEFPWLS